MVVRGLRVLEIVVSREFVSRYQNPEDFDSFRICRGIEMFQILVALGGHTRGTNSTDFWRRLQSGFVSGLCLGSCLG